MTINKEDPLQKWFKEHLVVMTVGGDKKQEENLRRQIEEKAREKLTEKKKKYKVVIEWGSTGGETKTYYFDTEKEKEIFAYGVDEANGWMDYKIIEEDK